ncbi:bifunctional folylpolyglutamate synthase/dihydrofolate synthase [Labrys miyagiensis]|uniref:Dihydrofolate synthase/folylpolyglutamate synthase n=1 Tax=Labrys miyagiensis TaxID=346912 RepID=A0ABQ6CBA9_9HYPH|nr:folylpolyglutamate synthase/dihydrofolate synthase family protein [Labrys miyagiensis]GLS17235.1 bifunctional folylpolyglutamate synthase/dihydrofolate synthase [Labrys miyagiensis]
MTQSDAYLSRFMALHPKKIDLSLERIEALLAKLGHPERKVPPVIHVAGTNGKGSTIAFMRAALEAAGYGVHVYTSPHLVHFHERIRLAAPKGVSGGGRLVDEDRLVEAFEACEKVNDGAPITFFEITTAAAFKLFADNPADVLLLEVGLGGRMDTTNVIDRPLVSVIASISQDHADFLGTDIAGIAREKAGILKPGSPGVIYPQIDEVRAVIEAVAAKVGAPLIIGGQDFDVHEENGRLVYQDESGLLDLPLPRLSGRHQHRNAGLAIAALRSQSLFHMKDAHFEKAMQTVEWPARLQRINQGAIPALLPAGSEIWLDGGHNVDGGRVLAEALAELEERRPRPLVLVTGMLTTKDSDGFLHNFSGLAREVHTVPIEHSSAARSPEEVALAARHAGLAARPHASLEEALRAIASEAFTVAPRVVLTGSLYLAGEVLAFNGTAPK